MKKGFFMRRLFKRVIAVSLITAMSVSIVSCGDNGSKKEVFTEDEVVEGDRLQADWTATSIIYEVNVRQYTDEGTFNAFSEHLERLKDLGVTTLWFMPIYPISQVNKKGELGSYYSIADYKSVNSEFGTMEDFQALVDKAHEMGFNVIIDWVANHTGWDHTWITEHPDYYMHDENGNIVWPLNTDWTDVAQLNYDNPDMRLAMIDAMKFWISDVGIDGFRCDYAQGVPADFWEEARAALDEIKPIFMVAEDGTESQSILNKAFDSDYNFRLYDAIKLASGVPNSADNLANLVDCDLPYGSYKMNFIDNHDKNTYDGTLEERFGTKSLGAIYAILFTAEGVPLIYSGNEEDTNISLEFFTKDNVDFGDYKWTELISAFAKIRTGYEPLYAGTYGGQVRLVEEDNKSVIAYKRVKNGVQIEVVVNLSSKEQTVKYTDKMSEGTILIHGDENGIIDSEADKKKLNVKDLNTLSPFEYYIVVSK